MTLVETIARAICASDGLDWDAQASFMTSAGGSDEEQQGYRLRARAALEAMRDNATDEMLIAGRRSHTDGHGVPTIFRTMIDAALSEESA